MMMLQWGLASHSYLEGALANLQCDSDNDVGSIPEGDVPAVPPARWRIPRHDRKVQLHQHVEVDDKVPGAELATW